METMEAADANLQSAIENGKADVSARQAAVVQLQEQLKAVDMSTAAGAAKAADLATELTAAKGRLNNAIATTKDAVQKAQNNRDISYTQNQRATEKARNDLNLHFAVMRNLLLPEVQELNESVSGSPDAEAL